MYRAKKKKTSKVEGRGGYNNDNNTGTRCIKIGGKKRIVSTKKVLHLNDAFIIWSVLAIVIVMRWNAWCR
jgi:hypothetical protein